MANAFQKWLIDRGYKRDEKNLHWLKDNEVVTGKVLYDKFLEWKYLW